MQTLKQSTTASLIVGPILDSTGVEYASAVIGDLSISKNGGTLTALAAAATLTYIANGYYTLALTTGNTDTIGRLEISCNKSTYQMPPRAFSVLHANVYDVFYGSTALSTLTGVAQTADNNVILTDVTYGPAALKTLIDAIGVKTTNLPSDPADQSAVEAAIAAATSPLATAANLATIAGYLDTEIAAILANTNELQTRLPAALTEDGNMKSDALKLNGVTPNNLAAGEAMTLTTAYDFAKGDATMTESYRAAGAAPTPIQALYEILQNITEFAISGTVKTVKKLDGSTTAKTYTLDSATAPTSITEAT